MNKKYVIIFMLVFGFLARLGFAEGVSFKSNSKDKYGMPLTLTGILTKPEGIGPFPAVVLLHGCGGINQERDKAWVKRLVKLGYVTLQLDSFGPRSHSKICDNSSLMFALSKHRALDAYDAKSYLAGLAFVDKKNISVLGWSHGGWSVLRAINDPTSNIPVKESDAFTAAIAFYPYCNEPLYKTICPVLILIGESDEWTPAWNCSNYIPKKPTEHEIHVKVYPRAYHDFDWEGMDSNYKGHRLLYDPVAAKDAINQVKSFLAKYLK